MESSQQAGSLVENGLKEPCAAVLGSLYIPQNPSWLADSDRNYRRAGCSPFAERYRTELPRQRKVAFDRIRVMRLREVRYPGSNTSSRSDHHLRYVHQAIITGNE